MLAQKLRSQCNKLPKDGEYYRARVNTVAARVAKLMEDQDSHVYKAIMAKTQTPGAGCTYLEMPVSRVPEIYGDWIGILDAGFGPTLKGEITIACASTGVTVTLEGPNLDILRFIWVI